MGSARGLGSQLKIGRFLLRGVCTLAGEIRAVDKMVKYRVCQMVMSDMEGEGITQAVGGRMA